MKLVSRRQRGLSPLASASPLQADRACLHNPRKQVPNNAVFKHAFETHNPEARKQQVSHGLSWSLAVSHGPPQSLTISLYICEHLFAAE